MLLQVFALSGFIKALSTLTVTWMELFEKILKLNRAFENDGAVLRVSGVASSISCMQVAPPTTLDTDGPILLAANWFYLDGPIHLEDENGQMISCFLGQAGTNCLTQCLMPEEIFFSNF